ncbi:hypothetical protein [Streptomyces sp. NPDC056061]|uniref:hypothetical protein n=1 Tax=Streptomyces sp. NPDC056061 TaxID=3345700 RepID=UPI0035E09078
MIISDGEAGHPGDRTPQPGQSSSTYAPDPKTSSTACTPAKPPTPHSAARADSRSTRHVPVISLCVR